MKWLAEIRRRLAVLFRRDRFDRDLEEEMQSHLEMQVRDNLEAGMNAEEARYAAMRQFGNTTRLREKSREAWGWRWLESLGQDVGYGVRVLVKNPGFTAVAVLTLAVGIGANTTIFSLLNAVLTRKPHVEDADRVVLIWETPKNQRGRHVPTVSTYAEWRKQTQIFEDVALIQFTPQPANLSGLGRAERVNLVYCSTNYFSTLHVKPALGRTYFPEDASVGDSTTLVISHGLWERVFDSDPDVLGKTVALNGVSKTIIGVLPREFTVVPFDLGVDVWVGWGANSPGMRWLTPIARLRPGKSVAQATVELSALNQHLTEAESTGGQAWGVSIATLTNRYYSGGAPPTFRYFFGAVGFVLLIACVNVANLLLARAATRRKEIAVRASLGAGRLRLFRQLLTESALLALLGGVLSVLVAFWGINLVLALSPASNIRLIGVHIDATVLVFTLGLSLFTVILFGLAPALRASKLDLNASLKESGGRAFGASRNATRNVLVVTEIALALVLLIGAGLMINAIMRLQRVDLGFNPKNVLAASMTPDGPKYILKLPNNDRRVTPQGDELFRQLLERLKNLPGVESAAVKSSGNCLFDVIGRTEQARGQSAFCNGVSQDYFRTLQIPLRRGRLLTEYDAEGAPWVVVINETMARQFFPDEDPIGKVLQLMIGSRGRAVAEDQTRQIVGVVADTKRFPGDRGAPAMYGSYRQHVPVFPGGSYVSHVSKQVMIRTASNPMKLAGPLQQIVAGLDKDVAVFDVQTMEQAIAGSLASDRFLMRLFGIFGGMALLLAVVGIYGLMSYSVTQRTHEIGVRMAVGAQPGDVLKMFLWSGFKLVLIGVAVGIAVSLALTRLTSFAFYGVRSYDPLTYGIVSLVLTLVALAACAIPARRAARIDPIEALRCE